jgi:hypothetical protein
MLKLFALAILLSGSGFAQTRAPVEIPSEQPGEISGRTCKVPEGFRCGILFDVDLPDSGRMIASMVGGVVRQISLIIGGTLYTVVFDPPLKRDDKFSGLKRWVRVPVRIDGDVLTVYWPDKTEVKGRVVQREKIEPELPQPA